MSYTRDQIIAIITQEAQQLGVPVNLALAIANQESGLDPNSIGDGGHSVGLFQLNDQGEGAGMSVSAREDPVANARIALTQVANVLKANPNMTPGQVAAAAQRPADRAGYAQAIDKALGVQLSPEQYNDMSPSGQQYRDTAVAAANAAGSDAAGVAAAGSANGDIDGFLKSQAPEIARALGDPQVQDLLQRWGDNRLSDQDFQNQLEQTSWWRNTPQNQRQMLVQQATDPASATQNLQNQMASVDKLGWQLGVHMTPQDVYNIALDSLKNGWDSAEIQQQVAAKFNYTGQQLQGAAGTDLSSLQKMYADYALPASQQKLNTQLGLILSGKQTAQDVQAQIQQQAETLYSTNPQLAQAIKNGMTVTQWADPYLQHAASLLGLNPNSINLTSPMWQKVLNPYTDPNSGASTGQAMSLDQWDKMLRTDPTYGFDTSQNAVNTASQFANQLVQKLTGASL